VIDPSNWICSVLVHKKEQKNEMNCEHNRFSLFSPFFLSFFSVLFRYILLFFYALDRQIPMYIQNGWVEYEMEGISIFLFFLCEYTEAKTLVIEIKKKKKEKENAFTYCRILHSWRYNVTDRLYIVCCRTVIIFNFIRIFFFLLLFMYKWVWLLPLIVKIIMFRSY